MDFGTVAENIRVRRSFDAESRMNSRSSRKPRSSISSASSRTTAFSPDGLKEPRSIWSRRRPGVPTTICAPFCSARRSSRISMPPTQEAKDAPVISYSHCSSRLTCSANSRVGATIRANGVDARAKRSAPSSRSPAIAIPKAIVLPEPVCAETSASAPTRVGASTAFWTGVNVS